MGCERSYAAPWDQTLATNVAASGTYTKAGGVSTVTLEVRVDEVQRGASAPLLKLRLVETTSAAPDGFDGRTITLGDRDGHAWKVEIEDSLRPVTVTGGTFTVTKVAMRPADAQLQGWILMAVTMLRATFALDTDVGSLTGSVTIG